MLYEIFNLFGYKLNMLEVYPILNILHMKISGIGIRNLNDLPQSLI